MKPILTWFHNGLTNYASKNTSSPYLTIIKIWWKIAFLHLISEVTKFEKKIYKVRNYDKSFSTDIGTGSNTKVILNFIKHRRRWDMAT